ncbi:MAG: IMP dehydrogenase [SAR324 cluster bacterium]|nr:IMP dehydrogenase [SAR324 cluster bacterium]
MGAQVGDRRQAQLVGGLRAGMGYCGTPSINQLRTQARFNRITGAVVGGLIIGGSEKVAEVYLSLYFGLGGIESFFGYLLAMLVLLVRPYGLFGDEIIERV